MPVVEVGSPPSQGVGGIPTKYLIIGAGVIAVAGLLIWQRRAPSTTSSDTSGDVQPTGSVSAELSSVQQMQLQQFGELTKLFAAQSDQIANGTSSVTGGINNLSSHLDTQAGALGAALSGVSGQVGATQDALSAALSTLLQQTRNLSYQITGQNDLMVLGQGASITKADLANGSAQPENVPAGGA